MVEHARKTSLVEDCAQCLYVSNVYSRYNKYVVHFYTDIINLEPISILIDITVSTRIRIDPIFCCAYSWGFKPRSASKLK